MIAPILRSFLILICLGLFAGHSLAQDSRFPAILVKGPGITLIECDVPRVFDDGTIAFKPTGEGGLEKGVVYAVFLGKQLLTRIQVTEEKGQGSLAKPVPGFLSLKGIPKGTKLTLKAVEGGGSFKYVPLRMDELEIDVKVVANLAVTTMTMNFHNDLDRVLEGRLNFPLGEGQTVSRFAMTVNGKLREGVVVEKAKGRQVFENIVRQGIDPGLLEWTKGNVFKARVYPIPAKGDKKIVIAYEQELKDAGKGFLYSLPLHFKAKVDRFHLRAEVFKQDLAPDLGSNELATLRFEKWNESFLAETKKENYLPDQSLAFLLPKQADRQRIFVEEQDGKTYFYLTANPKVIRKAKVLPKKIGLIWDASASGRNRDLEKELAVLDAYFSKIGNLTVTLVVFRNELDKPREFTIQKGDWKKLAEVLRELPNDGGTQLGAVDLTKYDCDEFLLSTDGVSNFGESELIHGKSPIYTLNSSPVAEHAYLRYLSQATAGAYLNLANLTKDEALSTLASVPYSFLGLKQNGKTVTETYPRTAVPVDGSFSLAGMLAGKGAELTLEFGSGGKVLHTEKVTLDHKPHASDSGLARRIWAQKKIAEMELRPNKYEEEITELGKEHSIVTRNTSLIVLDRLEDYVTHRIIPPEPDLRQQYFTKIEQQQKEEDKSREQRLAGVIKKFEQRVTWWNKTFKFGSGKPRQLSKKDEPSGGERAGFLSGVANFFSSADAEAPSDVAGDSDEALMLDGLDQELQIVDASEQLGLAAPSPSARFGLSMEEGVDFSLIRANSLETTVDAEDKANGRPSAGAIKLKKWNPKTPYLAKLKKAKEADWYSVYLEQRKENEGSSAFFLDLADFFTEKKESGLALRILSNVAEMELENPQLLRILGYRLMQIGRYKLAVAVFEEVLKMREEEPQSYRDLALALAADKQHQRAVDLLRQVVEGQWDNRFPDVELTALNELNAIIATCGKELEAGNLDKRLRKNLPVDVRVILTWDADNTDMDLWVTDPNGEKCFYSHRNTYIGGHMSPDYTGGYGPEEFLLKRAQPGKYFVHVNYYGNQQQIIAGATTVQLEMTTDFGKSNAKTEAVTLRLQGQKEVIKVGEFVVPGKKDKQQAVSKEKK
jgi:tetratricopeptide (TPR) repeat protein